jgi:hypothetical protein
VTVGAAFAQARLRHKLFVVSQALWRGTWGQC